ncbi:MAG: hypothetical protein HY692_08750, partial [Cyanobacteria bacterium NC_groundwater_1444_Ag_S-0.65um_54_12]|nr:hypothetical protein [Cyanobacteria bacterium NC_groundwater_1444_Ag_S-0.65um_54_12]
MTKKYSLVSLVAGILLVTAVSPNSKAQFNQESAELARLQLPRIKGLVELDKLLARYRQVQAGSGEDPLLLAKDLAALVNTASPAIGLRARLVQADCLARGGYLQEAAVLWGKVANLAPEYAAYC